MRTATPRSFALRFLLAPSLRLVCRVSRKRKKTYKPKEGWEDGTPPPHTGISREGRCVASRRPPLGVCLFLSLFAVPRRFSLQPSCHLAVVPLSSFFPLFVASSSVASLSSASFCDAAAACRSLVLAASCAFRRSSALLAAYPGPSSLSIELSSSKDERVF